MGRFKNLREACWPLHANLSASQIMGGTALSSRVPGDQMCCLVTIPARDDGWPDACVTVILNTACQVNNPSPTAECVNSHTAVASSRGPEASEGIMKLENFERIRRFLHLPIIVIAGAVVLTALAPSLASAQDAPTEPGRSGAPRQAVETQTSPIIASRPTITAVRVEEAPAVDGRLDDLAWRTASRVTEFFQRPGRAIEGAPASEQTEVFVAYTEDALYFGIHAYYADPTQIRASRVDRDEIQPDDKVSLYIDPFLDLQRAYGFSVNPYGVQRDGVWTATGGPGGDDSWDALFETAGRIVEDGWTAEVAIPFKSLRYTARGVGEPHRWGLQIERDIEFKNEASTWAPISSDVMGFISQMGVLEGMTDVSTNRNLEILPTFTAIQFGTLDTAGRFGTDSVQEAGLNVKYGLTPNLTLDFTLNPDFSQIESDRPQIEVNQRFPVFFQELRPFFLEGQEIYDIPGPVTLVHTRTVVDPRFGAKLSGKTGRTTFSLLVADDTAPGKADDPADPVFEQSAQAVIARAKFDLYPRSYLGVTFTDREFADSYSRLAGVDGDLWFGENYRLTFRALGSARRDLNEIRQTGPQWNFAFRNEGRNLSYAVIHYQIHPEFGTDLGFVRRTDQQHLRTEASYTWWPGTWLLSWGPEFRYERGYTYRDTVLQDETAEGGVNFQLAKNIRMRANVERVLERFREINFRKTRFSASGSVNTNRKIAFEVGINGGDEIRFSASPFLGRTTGFSFGATLRPTTRLQSEISLETNRFTDVRTDIEVFDIKILHAVTTYQFTDRLLVRNILDHDTFNKTLLGSILATYRVNAGTVFFVGYDDAHRQGDQLDPLIFPTARYRRTNRAVFTKLQYLFRY